MTLRKILIIPFIISLIFFGIYSSSMLADLRELMGGAYPWFVASMGIVLAVAVQFLAHTIRAYKMSYLMKPIARTSVDMQFRALSIGYLFNTVLPFRIGELIRTQVIAFNQVISFGFSLAMIIIERLIDVMMLTVVAQVFVQVDVLPRSIQPYLISAGGIALAVLAIILVVTGEYAPVVRFVHRFTSLYNDTIKVRMRFKYWSILYGLKQVATPSRIGIYVLFSAAMWTSYAVSVWLLLVAVQPFVVATAHIAAPFYAMSIPFGPANLGSYSHVYYELTQGQPILTEKSQALATWAFLVIPMGVVGLFNTLRSRVPVWRRLKKGADTSDLVNKLARERDISHELALFLDNYFKGNTLSRIVNRREQAKDFRLLRYFKGGSDAITILVDKSGKSVVEKIIAIDLKDRLKAQYDWLVAHKDKNIVTVKGEETADDYYAINLEYHPDDEMFFEHMHHSSLDESKRVLNETWQALNRTVHKKTKKVVDHEAVTGYINKHFYECLEKALSVSGDLSAVTTSETIVINGKQYMNAYAIMATIKKNRAAMKDLATYTSSGAVHGDVAIDNILVDKSTGRVTIIDPAPDGNIINGRVFDFGKNMQSLYCGYEFLFRSDEPATLGTDGSISYRDQRSLRYTQLCNYVRDELAPKYLTKAEQRAIIFHAGVLLIRRLKHQVYQDPQLTLPMYAAGVKALNDFYDTYRG
jgi:hypothetical protein